MIRLNAEEQADVASSLILAHYMLARIAEGKTYSYEDWDINMALIEKALEGKNMSRLRGVKA